MEVSESQIEDVLVSASVLTRDLVQLALNDVAFQVHLVNLDEQR